MDVKAAVAAAVAKLDAATTMSYTTKATIAADEPEGATFSTTQRRIAVDEGGKLMSVAAEISGDGPDLSFQVVVSPKGTYMTSPQWTGVRAGKWIRSTTAVTTVTTLPDAVSAFVPRSYGDGTAGTVINGSLPAGVALELAGITKPLQDPAFVKSLTGTWEAAMTISPSGDVEGVALLAGRTIAGESSKNDWADVGPVLDDAGGKLAITSIGQPVTITVPKSAQILKGYTAELG